MNAERGICLLDICLKHTFAPNDDRLFIINFYLNIYINQLFVNRFTVKITIKCNKEHFIHDICFQTMIIVSILILIYICS